MPFYPDIGRGFLSIDARRHIADQEPFERPGLTALQILSSGEQTALQPVLDALSRVMPSFRATAKLHFTYQGFLDRQQPAMTDGQRRTVISSAAAALRREASAMGPGTVWFTTVRLGLHRDNPRSSNGTVICLAEGDGAARLLEFGARVRERL